MTGELPLQPTPPERYAPHISGNSTASLLNFLALVPWFAMPALMLLPALIFRGKGPEPGSSQDDDGGGGGGGPRVPRSPRDVPRGGLPLPDAEPARIRIRGHDRPGLAAPRQRRPAHEPARRPTRVPHARSLVRLH